MTNIIDILTKYLDNQIAVDQSTKISKTVY